MLLSPLTVNNDSSIDSLYHLCKENDIEKLRSILPRIGNINMINQIQTSTGSTCLHVACYYGHCDIVKILLENGALHSIRNLRHNLTPYEETSRDDIKQLFIEQQKSFSNGDYDYIEWSMIGDDLLEKRREFRRKIDLYKTYDNHHLVSKLLVEVIHYYLNEYLTNENNHSHDEITRQQIETIEGYFKEAIEKQDYLTYFIKAYTLTNFFYKVLNKDLALYVLDYFDQTKIFSSNHRLVNCLVHIVTLLINHPNFSQYQYQGICHRGMRITSNDFDQYQLDHHILNRAFLSTSTDQQVAKMFAGVDQQSHMRYTPEQNSALQYSCVCRYSIKNNSTAINIQNVSTRPDEKEVLIVPFTVFKVKSIKRNDLDDPTAPISIEIELEECEDARDDQNEVENGQTPRPSPLTSSDSEIKDVEDYVKFKQRKCRLYAMIGILMFVIALVLTVTIVITVVVKRHSPNNITAPISQDDIIEYQSLPGCPNISNRSSWNARSYTGRDKLTILPVTHIVVSSFPKVKSMMDQATCIKTIQGIQNYHMDENDWRDIGFNFLICSDNDDQHQIYRGRGWIYVGAHCKRFNDYSLGKDELLF